MVSWGSFKGSWSLGGDRCSLPSQSVHNLVPCLVLGLLTVHVHVCGLWRFCLACRTAASSFNVLHSHPVRVMGCFLCLTRFSCLARNVGSSFQESAFPKVLELSIQCVLGEDSQDICLTPLKLLVNIYLVGIWSMCGSMAVLGEGLPWLWDSSGTGEGSIVAESYRWKRDLGKEGPQMSHRRLLGELLIPSSRR